MLVPLLAVHDNCQALGSELTYMHIGLHVVGCWTIVLCQQIASVVVIELQVATNYRTVEYTCRTRDYLGAIRD